MFIENMKRFHFICETFFPYNMMNVEMKKSKQKYMSIKKKKKRIRLFKQNEKKRREKNKK